MEPILFDVVQLGQFPATRSRGREGRDRLEDKLVGKQRIDLTIDFTGVNAMTISFADEFLGKFLSTFDTEKFEATVKLAGLNAENFEAVEICLERRDTPAAVVNPDGSLTLVGDRILADTFAAIPQGKEFKANDVADALDLSAQNANNRLKRLATAGALRKTRSSAPSRGGKEFVYTVVTADVPDGQGLVDS
ncbi:STAS-like domain-containing protein [Nocardioides sp. BP30]|uniref:STAS-like domain-containing protein n=1 Tax=Nocardioides sp. BP30 TaxID=3036374 RepID=UPI0024696698|nr:STAS-like domain-containing protein [Nocardioides sp. BP30]WGL52135.1 STAS-like domain-containing protein [Nocardioides sp. BP30]